MQLAIVFDVFIRVERLRSLSHGSSLLLEHHLRQADDHPLSFSPASHCTSIVMGLAQKETPEATEVAGSGLASVLPVDAKPWYRTPHLIKLNLLIMTPLISSASIGYDGSMMNGLQSLPQWRRYFGSPEGATLGAMNAVYPAGKVVALFLVTWICDRFGRKPPIVIGLLTCIAFAVMQAVSQNMHTFIIA
ncbi:hypothetical protein BN1723_015700, partial [Verticillium longisporum]